MSSAPRKPPVSPQPEGGATDDSSVDGPAHQRVMNKLQHMQARLLWAETGVSLAVHPLHCYPPLYAVLGFLRHSPSALLYATVCSAGVSTPFTLCAVTHQCMQCWGFYTVHPLSCYTPLDAVLGFLRHSPSALLYTRVCSAGVSTLFTLCTVISCCMQCWLGHS